jgi:hypothetical protein
MPATNIPSACRIANIAVNDAMILSHDAIQSGWNFRKGQVAQIHNRMPLILAPNDYVRWLSDEPDPSDLLRPFPAGPMRMWPISTRVNKPENDDPSILEPIKLAASAA